MILDSWGGNVGFFCDKFLDGNVFLQTVQRPPHSFSLEVSWSLNLVLFLLQASEIDFKCLITCFAENQQMQFCSCCETVVVSSSDLRLHILKPQHCNLIHGPEMQQVPL